MTYMNSVVEYSGKVKARVLAHEGELLSVPWPQTYSIVLRVQTHLTCVTKRNTGVVSSYAILRSHVVQKLLLQEKLHCSNGHVTQLTHLI